MIISCSNMMKYTSILLLSVLSVLLIPLLQTAHAQNPLDQLIGGIKNLTGGASKAEIILQAKLDNLQTKQQAMLANQ